MKIVQVDLLRKAVQKLEMHSAEVANSGTVAHYVKEILNFRMSQHDVCLGPEY